MPVMNDTFATNAAAVANATGDAPPDAARLEWLWSEYEKQRDEAKQYQEEGMDIFPTPGHKRALATRNKFPSLPASLQSSKLKMFVNLCSDASIAMPSMMFDASGNEQLRVPVSAGPVLLELEKDGVTPCLVTDMVLNPTSITRAQGEKDFRSFIAGFTLQKVMDKYKCVLEIEDVKFPKMKYKGTLPPPSQHIRRPKTAHIEPERPEPPSGPGSTEAEALAYDEHMEERRKAAQLARIEALRAMEERESGIFVGGTKQSAAASSASSDIFTSSEAAQAAQEAELSQSPTDRFIAKKEGAKIEVIADEPAPAPVAAASSSSRTRAAAPSKPSTAAASAASTVAASASVATPAASFSSSVPSPTSSLPAHTISYLKSSAAGSAPISVPASEWDLDLGGGDTGAAALPAAVLVQVSLPLLSSAAELEVEITTLGLTLYSKPECSDKHSYQLHMLFPFLLDDANSECKFSKKTRTLTLSMPVTALKPLPADEDLPIDELDTASAQAATATATAAATPAPKIDWQAKLGLTNTIMYELVSE